MYTIMCHDDDSDTTSVADQWSVTSGLERTPRWNSDGSLNFDLEITQIITVAPIKLACDPGGLNR